MTRRRRLGGAGGPVRGPNRSCPFPNGGAERTVRGSPGLQTLRKGSGSPKLSTLPFFLCCWCRFLELFLASETLPSRGCPAWTEAWVHLGLGPGRGRWVETLGGRWGRLHLPRSYPLHPFRAGPVRSPPGEVSAAAPPASGAQAPARRRGSDCPSGPGA